jgi:hypothetical protein
MTEPQAPAIDTPEETPEGERWEYVIKEPVEDVHTGYVVHVTKPTDAQLLVLLRLVDSMEDNAADSVRLYGDVLEALMDEEKREGFRVQRGLIKGHLDENDFINMGPEIIKHFFPGAIDNRAARRAGAQATRRPKR